METDLAIDPQKLKFYPKNKDDVIVQDVALTNKTNKDINIKSIEVHYSQPLERTSDYIELPNADEIKKIKPQQTVTLKTLLKKGAPIGRFNGNIIIKTDLKSKSNFTIRFWGKIPGEDEHPFKDAPQKPKIQKEHKNKANKANKG